MFSSICFLPLAEKSCPAAETTLITSPAHEAGYSNIAANVLTYIKCETFNQAGSMYRAVTGAKDLEFVFDLGCTVRGCIPWLQQFDKSSSTFCTRSPYPDCA